MPNVMWPRGINFLFLSLIFPIWTMGKEILWPFSRENLAATTENTCSGSQFSLGAGWGITWAVSTQTRA